MKKELIQVWCIKYALTQGIFQLSGEILDGGYFSEVRNSSGYHFGHFLNKKEYCLSLEDAQAAAEAMRQRKIKSLEKQLEKLKKTEIAIIATKDE